MEALQKISEAPLLSCPECKEDTLTKQISKVAFRLKGTGWYETDFKDKKKTDDKDSGKSGSGTSSTSDKKSGGSDTSSTASTKDSSSKGSSGDKKTTKASGD